MRKQWLLALTALVLAPSTIRATVLYEPTAIGASLRAADYGTSNGSGFRTFDDFTSIPGALVQKVSWRGIYIGAAQPAAAPTEDVTNWQLSFHADENGLPGASLLLATLSAADVTSTFQGTGEFSQSGVRYNVPFYSYSAVLPTAFQAAAGARYWIGFVGLSENFSPLFALLGGTGGDNRSVQQTLGAGMVVTETKEHSADRAIKLEGVELPEPGTYSLLTAGLALGALLLRRRA